VRSAALPKLEDIVNLPEKEDILGDWHVHTIASDGADTIENLGEEARRLGYKFLAICDHSKSVKGGIGEDMVKEEIKRIKDWNKKNDKVRLLGGIELEILEEGKLDFPSSITDDLDIVIGAIHHGYQDSIENLNERICYALQSGRINILGHLTGRLIQQRAPYPLDFLRIFALAEKMGTALEVNAHAIRMDLNVPLIRLAKNYNIKVAISSDAHIKWELSMIELGLILIRKALLRRNSLLFPKDITKF
jgi:DNA polymerase (family 10)